MGYCDESPMDSIKCNRDSFSKPMPWIGIYIAATSFICLFAMAANTVQGFCRRKFWFPSKFFALNAASLTVLGVATKLALDLNNPMPGSFDQFSKLSSVIFMATSMANFTPSLGAMNNKDVLLNMTALVILLITLLVNVSIQLGTGLIFLFRVELVLAVCFAFLLFWMMSCSALVVPTTKMILERKYLEISEMIAYENLEGGGVKLREAVIKYWLMAESSNPQYVMVRSPACFASSVISCLSAVVLCQAFIRLYLLRVQSEDGGHYSSDYQVLTYVIVWIQCLGVVIGTLAPLFRCFIVLKIKSSSGGRECSCTFSPEIYWTERLKKWKESHLPFQIGGRCFMKAIKKFEDMVLCFCIKLQVLTVVFCKLVLIFFLAFIRLLLPCFLQPKLGDSEVHDVSRYVLHLEGEDLLPEVMAENKNVLGKFFQKGIDQQPKQLLKLLEKMTANFNGVTKFDSNNDISRYPQVLPNCWKLPVITLTSIVIALLDSGVKEVENLLSSVSQGLKYVSIVDEILDTGGGLFKRVRDAADEAWSDLHLYGKFLNKDLSQMGCKKGNTPNDVLIELYEIARAYIGKNVELDKDCSRWPKKVIAAYSMQRISNSVWAEKVENEKLLEHIYVMIGDILGACLTNLPEAVTRKCSSVSIEKREETVQEMAHIIGETEEILKLLQNHPPPVNLESKKRIDIDEWRRSLMGMSLSVSSSLSRSNTSASASASASAWSVALPTFTDS
ncbi:PREDICTED: uncharacterized protein LOC109146636 [Ipomoea nil]|uniref:uncharacterized protein LOC109146636 n=1 Tax=Ipomoea nil TaxID=35883 RepID=UPI000900AD42|nr:PREDICTED: uncharacterized protein LOC109146636 [Ipomoea nil]